MSGRRDLASIRNWAKVCGLILAVLMLRVWENVQAERLERGLSQKRLEADRLTYENGRLQMQIHLYENPSNLEALAKQEAMLPLDPSKRVGLQI